MLLLSVSAAEIDFHTAMPRGVAKVPAQSIFQERHHVIEFVHFLAAICCMQIIQAKAACCGNGFSRAHVERDEDNDRQRHPQQWRGHLKIGWHERNGERTFLQCEKDGQQKPSHSSQ